MPQPERFGEGDPDQAEELIPKLARAALQACPALDPKPLLPNVYGNFHMLPSPTAAPMDARIKAMRPDQLSVVVVATDFDLLIIIGE